MTNAETNDKAATTAEQGAHVAPVKPARRNGLGRRKARPRPREALRPRTQRRPRERGKAQPNRARTKSAEVIAMMKRARGVTLAEIIAATGWQKHTVRGFVSILGSKGGENVESSKNAAGERSYHREVSAAPEVPYQTPLPVPSRGGVVASVPASDLPAVASPSCIRCVRSASKTVKGESLPPRTRGDRPAVVILTLDARPSPSTASCIVSDVTDP